MPLSGLNKFLETYEIDRDDLSKVVEAGISVEKLKLDIQKHECDPARIETKLRISVGERFLALLASIQTYSLLSLVCL